MKKLFLKRKLHVLHGDQPYRRYISFEPNFYNIPLPNSWNHFSLNSTFKCSGLLFESVFIVWTWFRRNVNYNLRENCLGLTKARGSSHLPHMNGNIMKISYAKKRRNVNINDSKIRHRLTSGQKHRTPTKCVSFIQRNNCNSQKLLFVCHLIGYDVKRK